MSQKIKYSIDLAEHYQEEEVLWNTRHHDYFNRSKRKDALDRIGEAMGIDGKTLYYRFIFLYLTNCTQCMSELSRLEHENSSDP